MERLDLAPLPLGRRAAYRRVLAVLKAEKRRFLVGGGLGVSAHLARVVGEDLTVYLAPDDAAAGLAALATAGFKVDADPGGGRARVAHGPHAVDVAWALPAALGGRLDEAWFAHDARTRLLDLRVRVAPLEELLWLRLAGRGDAVVGDAVVEEILCRHGPRLDWGRLLGRLAGLEALVLAELFLLRHRHPEATRAAVPPWVLPALLARVNLRAAVPVEPAAH